VVISWHSRDRSTQKSAKNKNHPHKLQDFLFLKASCKGVVSDATKRALAAEACMKAEQKSLEQSRQNAAKLLAEAESVEDAQDQRTRPYFLYLCDLLLYRS